MPDGCQRFGCASFPTVKLEENVNLEAVALANIRHKRKAQQSMAAQLGVSVRTLERRVLRTRGMNLAQWLRRLRLDHAQKMLLDGVSVKRTAYECGYSIAGLSSNFKAFYGYSPSTRIDYQI